MTLIRNLWKHTNPQPPGRMEGDLAVVGGSASVPVELHIEGIEEDQTIKMTSKEDGATHWIYCWTTPLKKSADEPTKAVEPAKTTKGPVQ